jgi:hypothetical protein
MHGTSRFDLGHAQLEGDPDLYVSCASFPNATNYRWSSVGFGSDSITLPAANACGSQYYGIGVLAWGATSFQIAATTADAGFALVDSVPVVSQARLVRSAVPPCSGPTNSR